MAIQKKCGLITFFLFEFIKFNGDNMLIMTKSSLATMISFFISIMIGIILIPILKAKKKEQVINKYLLKEHSSKKETPTMGGIIFIVATLISVLLLFIMKKINISYNLITILWTFVSYGLIGYLDDYLIIKNKNNKGLKYTDKLLLQIIVAIVFFYLFMKAGNEPLLWIHTLSIKMDIGVFYGFFILFLLVAGSNAVNLTDGLDGLAGGLTVISFFTFGLITWNAGWLYGYKDIAIFCFCLVGAILGFLVFNVNPAKVFMGDTGSLCLGATLSAVAILTRRELLLVVIGIVFVFETISVILQVTYFKITKGKRLFKMTPIHHDLEKRGMKERDIVKLFWIIGLIGSMIAIAFGVWI